MPGSFDPSLRDEWAREHASTRADFEKAASVALAELERSVATGTSELELAWPDVPVARHRFHAQARADRDLETARREGWLVSPGDARPSNPHGELAGLRLAVKDVIDVAGHETRNGTPRAAWRRPTTSSLAWKRAEGQGAWFIGKAATHEMAWGVVTPSIANPLDRTRITGGSSGGSAAVVAAEVADAALGTDTGGSIRIPAALCGVVGIRPTIGSVPMEGVTPLAPTQDVVGPLAADLPTAGAVLEVLSGRPLAGVRLSRPRVGYPAELGALDDDVAESWEHTLRKLRSAGVGVVALPAIPLRLSGAVSLVTMLLESARLHEAALEADPRGFGGEAAALISLGKMVRPQELALHQARVRLTQITKELFHNQALDAVITPTTACVAPERSASTVRLGGRDTPVSAALTRFTAWAAAVGLPAISVPVASRSLPVGMQIMSPPHGEAITLEVARLVLSRGTTSEAD